MSFQNATSCWRLDPDVTDGDNVEMLPDLSGGSLCLDKRPLRSGFYQAAVTDRLEMKVRTPESISCHHPGVIGGGMTHGPPSLCVCLTCILSLWCKTRQCFFPVVMVTGAAIVTVTYQLMLWPKEMLLRAATISPSKENSLPTTFTID